MNNSERNRLLLGYKKAEALTKKHARTFYFASRFLAEEKRYAAYSIYAVCRISDDAVDEFGRQQYAGDLGRIKEMIKSAYADSAQKEEILVAFRETINKYGIPPIYFDELLEGMKMDLDKNRYESFAQLYKYCYRVAGVVGLMMLKIFGYVNPEAEKYAVNLGIAMQLTNILRDIKEDFLRNRIYLPGEEMRHFSVTEEVISRQKNSECLRKLLKFQIERARQYYSGSTPGIKMIKNRNSRFVVCLIKDMYSGILSSIEQNNYDVFSRQAYVGIAGKLSVLFKILLTGQYL